MRELMRIEKDCERLGFETPTCFYENRILLLKGTPDAGVSELDFWERKLKEARNLAAYQLRHKHYDNYSYMYHVEEVARYCRFYTEGCSAVEQVIAEICGLLHDVEEDGDLTFNDIKREFGEYIAEVTIRVSDEKGRNRQERKPDTLYEEMKEVTGSVLVKLCDRMSNQKNGKIRGGGMKKTYMKEHGGFKSKLHTVGVLEEVWVSLEALTGLGDA
jgi:(p)ppGpp synthase/HD superfamily hydrolase|tara:strand:- start:13415 stop:14062 length:648 start_codon:yes stop_codon:yes gene_type:complete